MMRQSEHLHTWRALGTDRLFCRCGVIGIPHQEDAGIGVLRPLVQPTGAMHVPDDPNGIVLQ